MPRDPDACLPSRWRTRLDAWQGSPAGPFRAAYGNNRQLIQRRIAEFHALLDLFSARFGEDRPCLLLRVPARINLRGMHIDHRGGTVNYLTIGRELLMVAAAREDTQVHLVNRDGEAYPDRDFDFNKSGPRAGQAWMEFVNSAAITPGDWLHYIEAAIYRLIHEDPDATFRGMDLAVTGDIPPGAGLSSSSSLVVAAALAFDAVNGREHDPLELARLCGEAEWYVGTRGGAGDHTAMIHAKRDHILRTRFHPITAENHPVPDGVAVVLCHSGVEARKAAGARDIYNARVCAADIGLALLRQQNPGSASRMEHLRDVTTANLDVAADRLRQMLSRLPERMTRAEVRDVLGEAAAFLVPMFASHNEPAEGYGVLGVVLYVLAECERGRRFSEYLAEGDPTGAGRLMNDGHDGDRVACLDSDGKMQLWTGFSGQEMIELWERLEREGEPDPLARVPGRYACSHEHVDRLVDLCRQSDGVHGASLTGAGLGGYVVVLVREDEAQALVEHLGDEFYTPMNRPNGAEICRFVEGAGCLRFSD